MTEDWVQVLVRARPDRADLISNLFVLVGSAGTVVHEEDDDAVVIGYLANDDRLNERLAELNDRLQVAVTELGGIDLGSMQIASLSSEDWAENWKSFFTPSDVGRRFRIQPSWCSVDQDTTDSDREQRIVLALDPGMAFGTGHHATTRFCLELLEEYVQPGQSVLDIGTGSGILAIAARKLGAGSVVALDNDPLAIAAARENIQRNLTETSARGHDGDVDVTGAVETILGDLSDCREHLYHLVVANLTSVDIMRLLKGLSRILRPGGCFIASGISMEHQSEIEAALPRAKLGIDRRLMDEEWMAVAAHLHPL